jgi:integrase
MPKTADAEPERVQRGGSSQYAGEVRWTILDLEDIADAYWATVAPDLEADGFDPKTHRPTYEWLVDNGYRQFIYALQEYHDTTVVEFWNEILEDTVATEEEFDWEVQDDATRQALSDFVDRRLEYDDGFTISSARTHRSRLKRYVNTYRAEHGTDDLLSGIRPGNEENLPDETFRVRDVLDVLNNALSERTAYRIYRLVSRWYDNLVQNNQIAANPTGSLGREYGWHQSPPTGSDPTPLSSEHVSALVDAAADSREEMMVVGLCAWGLRLSEVASLHRQQLHLDIDKPYISFQERKNGPGEVSILYGEEMARERIHSLVNEQKEWSGYLFPSDRSSTGHRNEDTVRQWFYDLADRADVPSTLDGDSLKPHMGRRFWYDRYAATMEELFEYARDMADDQGSKSISTIFQRYMEEGRLRSQRREFMRDRLREAFEGQSFEEL